MSIYKGKFYEEEGIVLDILSYPRGKYRVRLPQGSRVVQLLGTSMFTLLEASLLPGETAEPLEVLKVGKESRDRIHKVLGRISYEELSPTARAELPVAVESIIRRDEQRFVAFFNHAGYVTPRMHAFDLLPGIGKKTVEVLLRSRPFSSFEDIEKKCGFDPVAKLKERILQELMGTERHFLFVRRPVGATELL